MSSTLAETGLNHLNAVKSSIIGLTKLIVDVLARHKSNDRSALFGGIILVVIGTHVYYFKKFSFWSERKLKSPKALPIVGNAFSFLYKARQDVDIEWRQKYGKVYGIYEGASPRLVCADVNLLKLICVKEFDRFTNRHGFGLPNRYSAQFLFSQFDYHWRGLRSIISPTFSGAKIRQIHKSLENCTKETIENLRDMTRKAPDGSITLDLKLFLRTLSSSSALTSFYGIRARKDAENERFSVETFARESDKLFRFRPFNVIMSSILPMRILRLLGIYTIPEKAMSFFAVSAAKLIEGRQNSSRQFNDYLKLLLDAKATDKEKVKIDKEMEAEMHHAIEIDMVQSNTDSARSKFKLNNEEITSQVIMFLIVATDTTATLMSNTIFLLANHPEIQQNLYDELMKINRQSENFSYEQLATCSYLDCVISESLRIMAPTVFADRVAGEDCYFEEYGLHIPKGCVVNLSYMAIMMDPDYWPDPEKFDPDRFKPENKSKIVPGSYCPFGIGPRACVGFRFALAEAKLAVAELVTKFIFAPNSEYPPRYKKRTYIFNVYENLKVNMKERLSQNL